MPTWPDTLPQNFIKGSLKDVEPDLAISFKTDCGPPMLRKRCEAGTRAISGDMRLTGAQKAALRTFYRTYAAESFDFPDPDDGSTIEVMFAGPPSYAPEPGLFWKVSLSLLEVVSAA